METHVTNASVADGIYPLISLYCAFSKENGKLDAQTSHKYAEYLLDALTDSNKELVAFHYATHVALSNTPYDYDGAYDTSYSLAEEYA
ncbi:hypothetical protein GQ600_16225 [Phytophthora cactorum]|nr:hypothetical protein GQ600_16225 [Phytophthora cactorum]